MDKMRELKEELKKTSAGRKFLEEAEPENHTDNLIKFAKEQCEIFPEDSDMGMYLRETIKILQTEPCEDAISKASVFEILGNLMSIPYDFDRQITEKDVSESMDEIGALSSITPTRKKGKWIGEKGYPICSECNCNIMEEYLSYSNYAEMYIPMKYCPNCGAEMESNE